jgi:hypothetical protein
MSIADEIREATARNELHPLVASNEASPRGLCNAHTERDGAAFFCTLDYGHKAELHENGTVRWSSTAICLRQWTGTGLAPFCCWQLQEFGQPTARCQRCADYRPRQLRCTHCDKVLIVVRANAYMKLDDGANLNIPSWHIVHPQPECFLWKGSHRVECVAEAPYGMTLDDFCTAGVS